MNVRTTLSDGYYLSAYLDISQLANIYRCGARHDECVALWKKTGNIVELVHYWEFERITGAKHERCSFFDVQQCKNTLVKLIAQYGLVWDDINEIWGVPQLNADDSYLSKHRYPAYTYHAMTHLATCLFIESEIYKKENILAFSLDGGSDNTIDYYTKNKADEDEHSKYNFMGCFSRAGTPDQIELFPMVSPGLLWKVAAIAQNMEEGSLMALASASKSTPLVKFENALISLQQWRKESETCADTNDELLNKSILIELDYLDKKYSAIQDEIMSWTAEDAGSKFDHYDTRFSEADNKKSMIIKVIMDMTFEFMVQTVDHAIEEYNIDPQNTYLGMSGGFALSCPTNTFLMNRYGFKDFIASPCPNDAGLALGIGLYAFFDKMQGEFDFHLNDAYYGNADDVETHLRSGIWDNFIECVDTFDVNLAVKDLMEEPFIWFDGNAELGPRALGARSLIGDPRNPKVKDRLNAIKLRQWWRPVAPIILKEELSKWMVEPHASPYMLHASRVRPEKRDAIPAVVHEDGTARIQSITADTGMQRLYQVMQAFFKQTGVPIICNTSLNDKGEPIIDKVDQAFNFALRKGISVGYFNGTRVKFKNHKEFQEHAPSKRAFRIPVWKDGAEQKDMMDRYAGNQYHTRLLDCYIYMNLAKGTELFDLTPEEQQKHMANIQYILRRVPAFNKEMISCRLIAEKQEKR